MNYQQKEDFKNCLYTALNDTNLGNQIERSAVHEAIEVIISALDLMDLEDETND